MITWLNFGIEALTDGQVPFLLYFPALAVIGLFVGPAAGVASTAAIAALASYFWISPVGNAVNLAHRSDAIALALFVMAALAVVAVCTLARRAILRVETTNARLDAAHLASRIVEWEWDLGTDHVHLSGAARSVFGASWKDLQRALSLAHPGERERIDKIVAEGLAAGGYQFTSQMIRPDTNEPRWLETIAKVHRNTSGQPTRVTGSSQDITEKHVLLEELRARERRFQAAMATASIIAWECDAQRRFTWIHSPEQRFSAAELLGRPIETLLPSETGDVYLTALERAWSTGEPERVEVTWSREGQTRYYLASINPIRDSAGRMTGLSSAAVDVTALRRAEVTARQNEERFHRAFVASPDCLAISRLSDGAIQEANPSFLKLFGFAQDEIVGRTSTELGLFVDPKDRPRAVDTLKREGRLRDFELQVRAKTGDVRTVQLSVETLPTENAELILSIFHDVTEQRRSDAARRESENLLRLALDGARLGTWSTDVATGLTQCSRRNREIFGLPVAGVDPISTDEWNALIHPEDLARVLATWHQSLARDVPFESEFRIVRPDGETRWIETSAQFQFDEERRPTRVFGVAADVSDRKAAEAALREESVRKDEFIATLAHELRNPLTPIRYATRLVRAETPAEMLDELRRMIDRQLAHMSRLLDDLLDASRITRGRLELKTEQIDLRDVVQSAVEAARPLADAVGHTIDMHLPNTALPVMGDATRLVQVIGNVLHNAIRYTDPGGHISITASSETSSMELEVRDDGIGIPPELLPRIFGLFTQGERSGRSTGGVGIGLALARRLIELHGGTIEAHSQGTGFGSRFVLRIPRAPETPALSQRVAAPQNVAVRNASGVRVLVVDDNVDAADALGHVLGLAGYTTHVAYDGTSAIELAELIRPAIVLLDVGLPNLSGHEVAQRIRREPWGRPMRLIAVTGWGREEDRRKSRDAGFDDHLTKPVDPEVLLGLMTQAHPPGGERWRPPGVSGSSAD